MNTMCRTCVKVPHLCTGEQNPIYSGCIYKVSPSQIREFRDMLAELDAKTFYADTCEARYEKAPCDADAEAAFDEAYRNEMHVLCRAVRVLGRLIGCEEKVARRMLIVEREKVDSILSRWRETR